MLSIRFSLLGHNTLQTSTNVPTFRGTFPKFPADRGSKLVLKVCTCMKIYKASHSRRPKSSEHRCENLKFDNACSTYQAATLDSRSRRDVGSKIPLIRGTCSVFFFFKKQKPPSQDIWGHYRTKINFIQNSPLRFAHLYALFIYLFAVYITTILVAQTR